MSAKKKKILHFWPQCPSASQQTGSEELQTLAFPWLFLLQSHQMLRSAHIYQHICPPQQPAFTLHPTPAVLWVMASVKLRFSVWVSSALIDRTSQKCCLTWPWRGGRSELTHVVNPNHPPSPLFILNTSKQWQLVCLVFTDTEARD